LIEEVRSIQYESGLDVLSKTRKREVVILRQVLMSLIKTYSQLTMHEVGIIFNKDHSTVVHALKACEQSRGMKDNWSVLMEQYYEVYEKRIASFIHSVSYKNKSLEDREAILEMKLRKREKEIRKLTSIYVKCATEKRFLLADVSRVKQSRDSWKSRYMELKSQYDIMNPSNEEEREVKRMQGYIA
jgi:hypothetical protein